MFMERPARRLRKRLERDIAKGLDPEAAIWPLTHKPHLYYW